jgi:hypothetical protein
MKTTVRISALGGRDYKVKNLPLTDEVERLLNWLADEEFLEWEDMEEEFTEIDFDNW